MVFLAPAITAVNVSGRVLTNLLDTTFSDDSLVVLVNGTGSFFVDARSSAVDVDAADFTMYGSGVIQASFKEIFARDDVSVRMPRRSEMTAKEPLYAFTITTTEMCMTSTDGTSGATYYNNTAPPQDPCRTYRVPVRSGRSGSLVTAPPSSAVQSRWTLFSTVVTLPLMAVLSNLWSRECSVRLLLNQLTSTRVRRDAGGE